MVFHCRHIHNLCIHSPVANLDYFKVFVFVFIANKAAINISTGHCMDIYLLSSSVSTKEWDMAGSYGRYVFDFKETAKSFSKMVVPLYLFHEQ